MDNNDEEVATASARAVLFSQDLWGEIWPGLDGPTKAALRGVCSAMRRLVDESIEVVASPRDGFSAADLTAALRNWPGVVHLTLLAVGDASTLRPLATATLMRLACLTVREPPEDEDGDEVLEWPLPVLSSALSATLQVMDLSFCLGLISIDAVHSCAQLRVLWMPGSGVSDLSPLTGCEALEELWLAGNEQVASLEPLGACTKLRKIDVRGCYFELYNQVADLQLTCTQLTDPVLVELEGLVHELQPGIPLDKQEVAVDELQNHNDMGDDKDTQSAIAAAGAIPALVQMLVRDPMSSVQTSAADLLASLAFAHEENQTAITAAGAIPHLVQLLGRESTAALQMAAAYVLGHMAANHARNQAAIAASGVIPLVVHLLGLDEMADVHRTAATTLGILADNHAQNQASIAGAIPRLVQLIGPDSHAGVQESAARALHHLAVSHAGNQAAITAAGAIPPLVRLLGPDSRADVMEAAANALWVLADFAENKAAIANAGAIPRLAAIAGGGAIPRLVRLLGADSPADVQASAADALCQLAANHAGNQAAITEAGW
ncbi:hypothetical protein FOA52_012911 [Chlamydomonas sp. UWO 241]|nr:hypothetical protein FOA52_012911 [Chlamydomonas sp. UWO 241]